MNNKIDDNVDESSNVQCNHPTMRSHSTWINTRKFANESEMDFAKVVRCWWPKSTTIHALYRAVVQHFPNNKWSDWRHSAWLQQLWIPWNGLHSSLRIHCECNSHHTHTANICIEFHLHPNLRVAWQSTDAAGAHGIVHVLMSCRWMRIANGHRRQ